MRAWGCSSCCVSCRRAAAGAGVPGGSVHKQHLWHGSHSCIHRFDSVAALS